MKPIAQAVTDQNRELAPVRIERNIYQPQNSLQQRVADIAEKHPLGLKHLTSKERAEWSRETSEVTTLIKKDPDVFLEDGQPFWKRKLTVCSIFKAFMAECFSV